MKMKLKEMIENVDYDDLVKLRSDLISGGKHIKSLVSKRLDELETDAKTCAVCGKPIIFGDDSYTLIFGRDDFKKKASFCALDCMDYFMSHVRNKYAKSGAASGMSGPGHNDHDDIMN